MAIHYAVHAVLILALIWLALALWDTNNINQRMNEQVKLLLDRVQLLRSQRNRYRDELLGRTGKRTQGTDSTAETAHVE